jgi:outer membrane protein
MKVWSWVFVSVAFAVANVSATELKIGHADAQRALEGSKLGQKMKGRLEDYLKARQKTIDSEEDALKALEEELVQKASVLSPDAKKAKEIEFQKKVEEYRRKAEQLSREVQREKGDRLREFNKSLEEAAQKIAQQEGFDYVFDRSPEGSGLLYAKESFDLTAKVIEQIDKAPAKIEAPPAK